MGAVLLVFNEYFYIHANVNWKIVPGCLEFINAGSVFLIKMA